MLLLFYLPIVAIAGVWLCFQDAPSVVRRVRLRPQDIENAKRLIDQYDPRKVNDSGPRTVAISEQELDLMCNYAAGHFGRGAARAGLRRMAATDRGGLAADIVKGASVANGRLTVTYVWSGEIEKRARAVALSPADQARLRAYHDRLVETVAKTPSKVSLATLMPPLFQTVLERGVGNDVISESRAAIAAAAGSPLADAIGLYKEVDDSRTGSGFSFNDIGADRAGARFGEVASQSPERARKLAQALASGIEESDFMPDVADLPEFMPEAEFKRRYGGIGGPGYNNMMATIEAWVASRPLLRGSPLAPCTPLDAGLEDDCGLSQGQRRGDSASLPTIRRAEPPAGPA